jgi:hypothetical protein
MTLLCRGAFAGLMASLEDAEYLAGDDPFEASFGLARRLAFGESAGDVGAGCGIDAAAGQCDGVQGSVELTVAATVEAVAVG